MVSVVTSAGAGLVNSSRDVLGAVGELGNSATGRAGERITVNAASGNLVVQGRDEYLVGVGPDVDLLRTYNSVGGWDGDNSDGWRLAYYRRVSGLSGPVNTLNSSIRRIDADGNETTYIHNGTRYVCTDGAGQHDALSFDGSSWTWTDGETGVKELYESAGTGNYRLRRVTDTDGNFVQVDYAASGLITALATYKAGTTVACETLTLSYVGTELQKVSTSYLDAQNQQKTRSVTSYIYANGKLDTVITDLSPEDSTVDANVYKLRYGYDSSGRLNSIQQTDGTQITIQYEAGTGRVASVLDGRGLGSSFTYDAVGTTTVKDALGQATKLKYGAKGELLEVSGAATGGSGFIQKYSYYANGDLWTSTNAKNETTTYEYNGTGALLRRTDAAGNVLERTYTSAGLVASETLYLLPDPDGVGGSGKASAPLTTNYYYDTSSGRRRLLYVIHGDGSLVSHVYDTVSGQLTDTFKYSHDVVFSGNRQIGSEVSAFVTQAFRTDKGIVRTHHAYDLRGLLTKVRTFGSSTYNASTNWVDFVDATSTLYTYDPSGRLLSRQDESGVKLAYEYDGLGRITRSVDNDNVQTIYSYGDADRETRVKLDNGQTTVQIFNRWGELVSSDVLGAGSTPANPKKLGETRYSYDDLGHLWRTIDATGVSAYSLYDISGRKSADIAANGQLTEYLHDAAGRLIQQIAYATPLPQAVLDALSASSTVSGVRPVNANQDRITTWYYDAAGRLTGELDAEGYLTETRYDGASAITSQRTYANPVLVNRLDAAQGSTRSTVPGMPVPTADADKDRTVRRLYDAAGRWVAQIDADGGLTRWTYDAAGNRRSQLRRSQLLSDSQRTTADLAALNALAPLADDEFTQWLYDGHGFQIAELSAEGHLTEYSYDAAGRLKDTLQYLVQAFKPVVTGSPNTLRWLQRSELSTLRPTLGTALKTSRTYNSLGLLERETSVDGTVTVHRYDKLHRLSTVTRAEGQLDQRVEVRVYDDWGRLQIAKTSGDPTEAITWYDAVGRRIRVKDARGNKTVYYYDKQGRERYAVLIDPVAGGEVAETIYSSFSEVQATVTHANRLSTAVANALVGGLADAALDAKVGLLSKADLDNRVSRAYDLRGLVKQVIDALGNKTEYGYNAFGQVGKEIRDVDPAGTPSARRLTLEHGFDRRGNLTRTERSGPGLAGPVSTRSSFDALGRVFNTTDELNRVDQYLYLRDVGVGRTVKVSGSAGNATTTYDALDRVLTRIDRASNKVTYTHDAANRKLTLKTAENIQTITEYTRHGQIWKLTDGTGSVTTYTYDAHGNLLTVTDALGNMTKKAYDANDNLVQLIQGLKANASGDPINDGSAVTTSYSFDAANRVLTQTVDPLVNGAGLNLQTRYEYDGQGRKLTITDPRGTVTRQVFNAKGELKEVIVDDVDGGLKLKTCYGYDAQSRVLTVTEGAGTASARKTAYAYDILGRRLSETVDPEGLKLKISHEYDAAGRLTLKRDALNNVVARYNYDAADRLRYSVDAMGAVTRYDYDGEGRLTAVRSYAASLPAGWAANAEGEFRVALDALGTSAADRLSVNAYDGDGRMIYSVDALSQVTERKFDMAGRVVMVRQYSAGIVGVTVGMNAAAIAGKLVKDDAKDHVTRFVYDKAGNQRFVINAEGFVSELRYDAAGRVAASVEHELPWTPGVGGVAIEAELAAAYTPTRSEFNTGLEGGGGAAGVWEAGRLKLVCEPVPNGTWAQFNGSKTMAVGALLKLDVQPMQLQQSLHLMLCDASGAPGRVAVIFEPTGRLFVQVLTPANQYITKDIGTYSTGSNSNYTVEIESTAKGAKIYFYAKGAARTSGLSYEAVEPSMAWQTVRTVFAVKREPSLPGPTVAYVDNVEEVPPLKGRVTQYAYDTAGRTRFSVDAEGYVSETRYDDANARTMTLRYAGRFGGGPGYAPSAFSPALKAFKDAIGGLGPTTSVVRELDRAGRLRLETDGNGVQTQFDYDAVGRLESEKRASNQPSQSSTTRYRYNAAGLRTEVIRGDGSSQPSSTRYAYDALGRLSKTIESRGVALAEGSGDWEKAERARLGHPSDLSTLTPEARAATQAALMERYTTEIRYDAVDRVRQVLRQVSSAGSNVTSTLVESTEYDAFGNAVKLTDARGHSRYQVFDKLDRVVQAIDAESYLNVYGYDAFGNRVSSLRLDARVQGTITAGQAVAVTSVAPASGPYVIANAPLDHLTGLEYDRNNRLLRETDAGNYVEGAVGALNAFGERTTVRNKLGFSTAYTFDRLGRVLTETLPVQVKDGNGTLKAVVNEYQYDSRGNRIVGIEARGLPEQRTTQMRYDGTDRLTMRIGMAYNALNADNTTSIVTPADSYRYDARGNLIEVISHGQLQANGGVTGGRRSVSYYDVLDRKTLEIGADRAVVRSLYDAAENLVEQTAYANRLAEAVVIDPGAVPIVTADAVNDRTYFHRYDELGREVETALGRLYSWDSGLTGNNLVISGLTAQRTTLQRSFYDAAGNLTEVQNGRGHSSYSYHDRLGRKVLAIDAGGAAIAWDYGRAGGIATRETRYSGMLTGGYARQADASAGLNESNNPVSLLAAVVGLSSHVADDDRITEVDLDRLDRVTEKRLLKVAQDFVDANGKRTKSVVTASTRFAYNGLGHVTQLKELATQLGADQAWEVSDIDYDEIGRETRRLGAVFTDWKGASVRSIADLEYNGLGDVARRILRGQDSGVETDDRITRYEYDANGVLTSTTDPSRAVMQYDYDAEGGLVRRTNLGVLRSDGTSRSIIHRYTLDAAGRIASETASESDKSAQAETRKTRYNAFGEASAKGIGEGWEEFFEYSTAGKIVKTNTGDGAIKFYVYDAAGNQTREIKGNGDVTVNLKVMTLEEATTSNQLFSRVSIYDKRNLITQTIDPQIEVLKNTVSMSALYSQAWVPEFQTTDPALTDAKILPNASVSIVSGAKPMLYLTNAGSGYAVVASTTPGVFWAETGNALGQPMPVDLSAMKGLGRYTLLYTARRSAGGGGWYGDDVPLAMGRIDITVAADGSVTYNLLQPVDQDRPPAYVKFPPDFRRPGQWTYYGVDTVVDGVMVTSASYYSNYNPTWPSYCWAAVEIGQFRPTSGFKDIFLHYSQAEMGISATTRVRIYADGSVQRIANDADPNTLPVRFSLVGRDIQLARITVTNRRTGATFNAYKGGVYTPANGTVPADTTFTWDLKGYLAEGDELDYTLEPLEANYTAKLDEGGQALVQKGRIVMSNGVPRVLKQVITLNTGETVAIKRFQEFNAFGEVSEERDERVGERMLAAINEERAQKGLTALAALTTVQQAAARTTLKYNTAGQLVQKLDPETFVTAENGYRFRARPETNYGYDLLGRMTTMQDANGNLSRVQYLPGSRRADARVQREFDGAGGNADVFNDTGGGIRLTDYDVFGDSRRLTEAQGSSEQRITERAYDERGLLTTVMRKGVQRLANGNTETLGAARDLTESFSYDALGQRLKAINALNITTRTDYDALGRVVQTVSGNGFVTSYGYSLRTVGQADGITSLPGVSSGGYVLTTQRADGRSLKDKIDYFGHTTWHKDLSGTEFTYSFNNAGQLIKQTSTLGQNIDYVYYANGYIRGFKDNYLLLLSEYAYDNAGNRIYEGTFDGAKTHSWQSAKITYDELNRISRVRDDHYFDVRYEFDAVGNRRRINSAYWDGLDGLRATQDYWYLYDKLNRFTTSKGRLETATGVATTARGTSVGDANIVIARGTEGTVLGYDKLSQRRLATYTYQSGNVAQTIDETYGYSQDGYLQTTKQGSTLVATRQLDDIGRTLVLTDLQNKQSTASTYDKDNRLLAQSFIGKIDNLGDTSGNYTLTYLYYANTADSGRSSNGTGAQAAVVQQPANGAGVTTTYKYKYWDDEKQVEISKGPQSYTTLDYDINGRISSTSDSSTGVTRIYVTNANGQVLRRSGSAGTHYFYYADGHRIGDVGNTPDDKSRVSYAEELARRGSAETTDQRRERYKNPSPVTSADFDQNYEPINDSYPGNAAISYSVQRNGETLRGIAQAMWGDSSLWYLIAEANGMLGDGSLLAGQVIVVPNKVTNIHNNSTTWRPYNAGEAIGRVDPMMLDTSASYGGGEPGYSYWDKHPSPLDDIQSLIGDSNPFFIIGGERTNAWQPSSSANNRSWINQVERDADPEHYTSSSGLAGQLVSWGSAAFSQDYAALETASDPYGLSDFSIRTSSGGFTSLPLRNSNEGYSALMRQMDSHFFSGEFGVGLGSSYTGSPSGRGSAPPMLDLDSRSLLNMVEHGTEYLPYRYLARDGSGHSTPQAAVLVEARRTISASHSYSLAATSAGDAAVLGYGWDSEYTPAIASGMGGIEGHIGRSLAPYVNTVATYPQHFKSAVLSELEDKGHIAVRNGDYAALRWLGIQHTFVGMMLPGSVLEAAMGVGAGAVLSKALPVVTAALNRLPVLGDTLPQLHNRLSAAWAQGMENLAAPRTLNSQFGGLRIGNGGVGNTAADPVVSRLAQPGGLYATEGAQIARADGSLATTHPLTKHGPDVTDQYIYDRVATELVRRDGTLRPGLRTAFKDRAQMEDAIAETIKLRQNDIDAWLASRPRPGVPESFSADPGLGNLGRGYQVTTRGGPIIPTALPMPNVNLVLIPDGNGGWLIHTAHPF